MTKSKKYTVNDFSRILIKNIIVIVILAIVGALGAGMYAKHKKTTTFSARSGVLVITNVDQTDYKNSAVMAEKGMMKTYEEIAGNQTTTKQARKYLPQRLKKNYDPERLASVVDVNSNPDSLILHIGAKTDSEKDSVTIANAVAKAAAKELPKYSLNHSQVRIVTQATKDSVVSRTTPSVKKYTVLGAALGLLIGMIISFSVTTWKKIN